MIKTAKEEHHATLQQLKAAEKGMQDKLNKVVCKRDALLLEGHSFQIEWHGAKRDILTREMETTQL